MNYSETVSKSIDVFRRLNNISREITENEISLKNISGISNSIYKIELNLRNEVDDEETEEIQFKSLLFRWFGKISYLVDRELEAKVINGLCRLNLGPSILDTDNQSYRIEEFIEGTTNIGVSEILEPEVLSQILNFFMKLYTIDDNDFFQCISSKFTNKEDLYNALLCHPDTNLYSFSYKLKEMARTSLDKFIKDFSDDKANLSKEQIEEFEMNILKLDYIVNNGVDELLNLCPELPIFVLSHNDAHPGNLLITQDRRVFLIDHEYACYNYLGFEIANFILESTFTLDWPEYPYFKQFKEFDVFLSESYYLIYSKFIDDYFDAHGHILEKQHMIIEQARYHYKNKKTYVNLISAASIYWTLYSIFYVEYNAIKSKESFDYVKYALTRYSAFEHFS